MGRKEHDRLLDEEDSGNSADAAENTKPEDMRILEALLFASDELMNAARLKAILPGQPDARKIRTMVEKINVQLQKERHPFEIVEIGGGYQFRTIAFYHPWVRQIFKEKAVKKLSIQALECLAIIAYKQPLSKAEIEAIRGVVSDGAMKTLLEKRLITIAGRSDKPGRPLLYSTTHVFLTYFGINKIEDLPRIEEFEALAREKMDELSLEELSLPELVEEGVPAEDDPAAETTASTDSSLFEVDVATTEELDGQAKGLKSVTPEDVASSGEIDADDVVADAPGSGEGLPMPDLAHSTDATVLDLDIDDPGDVDDDFEVTLAEENAVSPEPQKTEARHGVEEETVFYIVNKNGNSTSADAPKINPPIEAPEATVTFDSKEVVGRREAAESVSSGKVPGTSPVKDGQVVDDGMTVFDVTVENGVEDDQENGDVTFEVGEKEMGVARFSEDDMEQLGGAMMETKAIHPEKLQKKRKKADSRNGEDDENETAPS